MRWFQNDNRRLVAQKKRHITGSMSALLGSFKLLAAALLIAAFALALAAGG